jgi:hypothetical protein
VRKRELHGLDGSFDAGAVAAGRRKQHALDHAAMLAPPP